MKKFIALVPLVFIATSNGMFEKLFGTFNSPTIRLRENKEKIIQDSNLAVALALTCDKNLLTDAEMAEKLMTIKGNPKIVQEPCSAVDKVTDIYYGGHIEMVHTDATAQGILAAKIAEGCNTPNCLALKKAFNEADEKNQEQKRQALHKLLISKKQALDSITLSCRSNNSDTSITHETTISKN